MYQYIVDDGDGTLIENGTLGSLHFAANLMYKREYMELYILDTSQGDSIAWRFDAGYNPSWSLLDGYEIVRLENRLKALTKHEAP